MRQIKKIKLRELPENVREIVEAVLAEVIQLDDFRGEDGGRGDVGPRGRRGRRGAEGQTGESISAEFGLGDLATTIFLKHGDGDVSERDLQGEPGLVGRQGEPGPLGPVGPAGPRGPKGDVGDKGDAPAHEWDGATLRFRKPDGTWGRKVSLIGSPGGRGGSGAKEQFATITLNGTDLEFKKGGALGPDITVDLAALSTGATLDAQRIDEIGDILYVGDAVPGTLDADAVWRIKRITFVPTGPDTDSVTEWAGGVATRDKVWDNRLAESYS